MYIVLRHLEILWLSHNILLTASALETAFFGLKFALNLKELYLDKTNLTHINSMTFQFLVNTSVSFVEAGDSKLKFIHKGAFKHLPNLRHLAMRGSQIQDFQAKAFDSNNQLEQLDLKKNSLVYVPLGLSLNLRNLEILVLSTNSIRELFPRTLRGYDKLQELNLQNNGISKLLDNVFIHVPNLKSLLLTSNNIKYIYKDAFAGLKNLEFLELAKNDIVYISTETFSATPNLSYLALSENPHFGTEKVKNDVATLIKPLKKLSLVKLYSMSLQNLPYDVFYNLTELSIINIGNNLLSKLDSTMFKDQEKLTILSVRKNKLLSISRDILDPLSSHLEKFDISENMFRCDCDLLWFTNWIRTGQVYMSHLDSTTCKSPPQKRGIELQNLYLDRECMYYTVYVVYWGILFWNMIMITAVSMIYRLRWYIK